jgi:uncharacterized protein YceH (UPF0502 family)
MVSHTAGELAEDLQGTSAAPAPAPAPAAGEMDLPARVAALEAQVTKQRRVFQRLLDVLGGGGES